VLKLEGFDHGSQSLNVEGLVINYQDAILIETSSNRTSSRESWQVLLALFEREGLRCQDSLLVINRDFAFFHFFLSLQELWQGLDLDLGVAVSSLGLQQEARLEDGAKLRLGEQLSLAFEFFGDHLRDYKAEPDALSVHLLCGLQAAEQLE